MNVANSIFTTVTPDVIFELLVKKMEELGYTFEVSQSTWKLNFEYQQANENFEMAQRCKGKVEILKVREQEKFCVNFSRKAGSSVLFYDIANKFIDYLYPCNNTTLDD